MLPRALAKSRLRRHFSLAIPHGYDAEPTVSSTSPYDLKIRGLVHSLESGANHTVVWSTYNDVLSAMGAAALPLNLHQQVLRQCTLPKALHRESINKQISAQEFSAPFHVHENRFKTIVQNIASTGVKPTVEDYNFILDQLSSVGYYTGTFALYIHMTTKIGVVPNAKTFGLCFRAMAVRLSLPVPHDQHADLITHIAVIFQQLMKDHQRLAIPMTAPNMDSILRILKDTRDRPAFENVLATAYGIDLYNPDRLALQYANPAPGITPLPFTTAALNTTLDLLGRLGDISHLVSAFEVLTQPLPQAQQHFFNSFEDDEDDVSTGPVSLPPAPIPSPHAVPNTTTYNILLRHVCQHGHDVLARHYTIQAIRTDRYTSWVLRNMVMARRRHPERFAQIPSPRLAFNRLMLLPVLGMVNRDKDFALMRWLQSKMAYILRKQNADLEFYEGVVAELGLSTSDEPNLPPSPVKEKVASPLPENDDASSLLESSTSTRSPPTPKSFDPLLHMQILRRNVAELTAFAARLEYDYARTAQRVKERLGRRVWESRDIYVSDEGRRRFVDKDTWRQMVNFRPMPEGIDGGAYKRPRARGPFTSNPKPKLAEDAEQPGVGASKGQERKMSTVSVLPHASLGAPKSIITPPIPILWHMRARDS